MIDFDPNNPNDPDVRHFEFRPYLQAQESSIRRALRTGSFDEFYTLLDQHSLDHEQIEGCLMLLMVTYGRKTSNNEKLSECATALLERLTRPLTLVQLFTYGRGGTHVPLVRKFLSHCNASVATWAMLIASQQNNQQLFDLLYPHSDLEKAQRMVGRLTDEQRILFDERIARENCRCVLQQIVEDHGVARGESKL